MTRATAGSRSDVIPLDEIAKKVPLVVSRGHSMPLGATVSSTGVNFSVYSEHATGIELLLFDSPTAPEPFQTVAMTPDKNRTFHFWHCFVHDLPPGAHYAYRVDGPFDLANGHRFDRSKVLIDPFGKGHSHDLFNRGNACVPGDNVATSMRSVVIDTDNYDWEGDQPLRRPLNETIVYEMHVGGFTRSGNSEVTSPGTFRAVAEKIPYLKALGVTAVELLPVFAFDEQDVLRTSPVTGEPLHNYWGYDPYAWFAPASAYCVGDEVGSHVTEFRDMVKALHKAGIEVILDVVFNHTVEGNHLGPMISWRGWDNATFYMLSPADRQYYMDFSGCGNTVNANHPVVEMMISDALHYWVEEMHVDGFRFDEGSVLSRGEDGGPMRFPPVIWRIELSRRLIDTKVIAEAWDAGGLYQVGSFPGARWAQWNGKFRDDVRDFVRGTPGITASVASRICGSADIYQAGGELPTTSVNFVTAHDGFTMNDLVSYNSKHNDANGEGNRDGVDDNRSWNCGVEGDTDDPWIDRLRTQQVKNFLAILMLSQGVPMFVMGDEVRRGQEGNNNAYCQNNELTWFDWDAPERQSEMLRFTQLLTRFRRHHRSLQRAQFFSGAVSHHGLPDISWHGCELNGPGFNDPHCQVLAFTLAGLDPAENDLHVVMNMSDHELDFEIPQIEGRHWRKYVDTAALPPTDVATDLNSAPPWEGTELTASAHSVIVLASCDGSVPTPAAPPALEQAEVSDVPPATPTKRRPRASKES